MSINSRTNPALKRKIAQLRMKLQPLYPVHLPGGPPHTAFPQTVLHFWVLTETEIENCLRYYRQITPDWSTCTYPCPLVWDKKFLARPDPPQPTIEGQLTDVERLAIKRRMLGKFIGLRGCETPGWEMHLKLRWLEGQIQHEMERLERSSDTKMV
jgi:hypothetical protein